MVEDAEVTSTLDPCWTASIYQSLTGEDFLGLRAVQGNITGYLLPGIITITPRARYYAFYSWLLTEYRDNHPKGWSLGRFIKRREQIFALANLAHTDVAQEKPDWTGLTGSDKLKRHWNEHQSARSIPLSIDNYVQALHGGYDAYSGVMQALEMTRPSQADEGGLDVLPKGLQLSRAFAQSIKNTEYYQHRVRYDTAQIIPRSVLEEYGAHCHLDYLSQSADCKPTIEALFAFAVAHVLPHADSDRSNAGNMRGTLAMILDMIQQTSVPLWDDQFRKCVTYGLCDDFADYRPTLQLRPFVAHWQMFQLREYYVYGLYAIWAYFLRWLRNEGPQTLDNFCDHLNQSLDLSAVAAQVGISLTDKPLNEWFLSEWFDQLLRTAHIRGRDFHQRCTQFARQSKAALQEHTLYRCITESEPYDLSAYVGISWLLLSAVFLRLEGIKPDSEESWSPWYWARFGGARRRSLAYFVRDLTEQMNSGATLLETLRFLVRDYIVSQHTISALEKWRQRNAKTFHFNYENGVFEWVQDDGTGFSATRFRQAFDMLSDLGLYEFTEGSEGLPRLTPAGTKTLQRILEGLDG